MALEQELTEVAEVDPGSIQAWLDAKEVEVAGFVASNPAVSENNPNQKLLQQIKTIKQTERTPAELELWEKFAQVEQFVRGLADVDLLPSADEQLAALERDQKTTDEVMVETRELLSTSALATVLYERLLSVSSDLHVRIRHQSRLKKQELEQSEDPFGAFK